MPQATSVAETAESAPRILIVDDHALLNETLTPVLQKNEGFRVESFTDMDTAITQIETNGRYDAVLLDYDGPGMEGLDGLTRMIQANGGSVALFSGVANWSIVERAVKLGASGFIPKTLPVRTLGHAIRFIVDGELYLPSEFMLHKPDGANEFGLKPREMRALALLCEGKQNKEIGAELGVEETTVKADVKSICRKMGVRNRTEAVIKAIKMGMG
jgi:DNA-binding NarL/FixJ family response regulator